MKVKIALDNHQGTGTAFPTVRYQIMMVIHYVNGQISNRFPLTEVLQPRSSTLVEINAPDRFDVDGCMFCWFEGNPRIGRAGYIQRPKEYVGKPWNGAIITWADVNFFGSVHEYHFGGIGNVSGIDDIGSFGEIARDVPNIAPTEEVS
ncbi:hypothetical protein [Microvirga puerhi]|uniref:Uncharacterized protein n=1 Tax=Microvirga puerhi TaxID=2876078 RepID=A0ABS7VV44_9HYPH|nr:hypothetical protein [Microvirga puerhi]MBZ6078832.1 hypothetical protein [Microvirga puerhi]